MLDCETRVDIQINIKSQTKQTDENNAGNLRITPQTQWIENHMSIGDTFGRPQTTKHGKTKTSKDIPFAENSKEPGEKRQVTRILYAEHKRPYAAS